MATYVRLGMRLAVLFMFVFSVSIGTGSIEYNAASAGEKSSLAAAKKVSSADDDDSSIPETFD